MHLARKNDLAGGRLRVLDGLRGLVLFVPLIHFRSFYTGRTGAEDFYLYLGDLGIASLDVFFVLSGFLITGILIDSKDSLSYFTRFYARRALRIVPLYYGFLIGYFVLLPRLVSWPASAIDLPLQQQLPYWLYALNIDLSLAGDWTAAPGTNHLWSLSVEEQFYLLWPVVVKACSRTMLKRTCLVCLAVAPVLRVAVAMSTGEWSNVGVYVLMPTRMDGLALGSVFAILIREPHGLTPFLPWAKPIFLCAAGTLLGVFVYAGHLPTLDAPLITLGLTASVYLAGAIVLQSLHAREGGLWQRVLVSWPMQQVGRSSYGIYVLHVPIAYVLSQSGVLTQAHFRQWIPWRLGADLGYISAVTAVSIVVAAISWHAYEKHFLALRRYLPYVFTSTKAVVVRDR